MLMITASARRRASSTSARCPSWRYPIVGTSPTLRSAACCDLVQARSSGLEVISFKAVFLGGVFPLPYVGRVRSHCFPHRLAQLPVVLEELGRELLVEAEHVVEDQHLSV